MYKTLSNEFKYAEDFEITNEKVIYNKDSVFIMLFHMKGKKDNGDVTEGDLEYAYEEQTMWYYGHPDVRVWDDYLCEIKPFGKNSVERYLELMKSMAEDGYSMPIKSPYNIMESAAFSTFRKIPSEWSLKVKEYDKDNELK